MFRVILLTALLAPAAASAEDLKCYIFNLCLKGKCQDIKKDGEASPLLKIPFGLKNWNGKAPKLNSLVTKGRDTVIMTPTRTGTEFQWDGVNKAGATEIFVYGPAKGSFTYALVEPKKEPVVIAIGACEVTK